MDSLGRYYTKEFIGDLLVDQMMDVEPTRILDLGAGGGCLSFAASRRWTEAEMITVDVDDKVSTHLKELFSTRHGTRHSHINADALSSTLPKLISLQTDAIDAAVCNPPFITPKWRRGFGEILEETGFSGCLPVTGTVDAALLFLAQNLRLLSDQATLGIILPDSLVSSQKYRSFRRQLIERYQLHRTIRLPRQSFNNTDTLAYIAIISKGRRTDTDIPLQRLDKRFGLQEEILVSAEKAIERLDFNYHFQQAKVSVKSKNLISLATICVEIKRGSVCSSQRYENETPALHTTDFKTIASGCWVDLAKRGFEKTSVDNGLVVAQAGDILMARVGRNLESKVFGVHCGKSIVTDCVYVIRVPKEYRRSVLSQLSSPKGRDWIASRSYGVGAKQLSKSDLLEFPLNFFEAV